MRVFAVRRLCREKLVDGEVSMDVDRADRYGDALTLRKNLLELLGIESWN